LSDIIHSVNVRLWLTQYEFSLTTGRCKEAKELFSRTRNYLNFSCVSNTCISFAGLLTEIYTGVQYLVSMYANSYICSAYSS